MTDKERDPQEEYEGIPGGLLWLLTPAFKGYFAQTGFIVQEKELESGTRAVSLQEREGSKFFAHLLPLGICWVCEGLP